MLRSLFGLITPGDGIVATLSAAPATFVNEVNVFEVKPVVSITENDIFLCVVFGFILWFINIKEVTHSVNLSDYLFNQRNYWYN